MWKSTKITSIFNVFSRFNQIFSRFQIKFLLNFCTRSGPAKSCWLDRRIAGIQEGGGGSKKIKLKIIWKKIKQILFKTIIIASISLIFSKLNFVNKLIDYDNSFKIWKFRFLSIWGKLVWGEMLKQCARTPRIRSVDIY